MPTPLSPHAGNGDPWEGGGRVGSILQALGLVAGERLPDSEGDSPTPSPTYRLLQGTPGCLPLTPLRRLIKGNGRKLQTGWAVPPLLD